MSNSRSLEHDPASDVPLARLMVPILMAVGAVTLAIAVVQGEPSARAPAAGDAPDAPGTSYSEDHRRIQEAPGDAEPLPPTF
jgi:hypothetical protein